MQQNKGKIIKSAQKEISARRIPRCRILLIRRERRNIMHNFVLLHTTAVAEEVHLVRLLLVFFFHLLLLGGEPSLHLLLLSRQTRPQIL